MKTNFLLRVFCPALLISFGGIFHAGYQSVIFNPSVNVMENFINTSYYSHSNSYLTDSQWVKLWPLFLNMQIVAGFVGVPFISLSLEYFGRKRSFYLTNIIALVGIGLQGFSKWANAWEMLLIGRFVSGVSATIQMGLEPVYFTEISPMSKRGLMGSITGFMSQLGSVCGAILAMEIVLGTQSAWPYLFLIDCISSIVILGILPFMPESPKFLASRGDFDGAERALRFFGRTNAEAEKELEEIRFELAQEHYMKKMPLKTILTTPYVRKGLFLGWMMCVSSSFCGMIGLFYFSTDVFQRGGLSLESAQYGSVGMMLASIVGSVIGGSIIDKFGRRPIVLSCNAALLLCNILFVIFANMTRVHQVEWTSYANIVVSIFMSFIYGLGPGILMWFLTVELVPQSARATANSLSIVVLTILTAMAVLVFYPLQAAFNEFCFLFHILPLSITIIYFALALPETRGKSTLDIMLQLGQKQVDGIGEK